MGGCEKRKRKRKRTCWDTRGIEDRIGVSLVGFRKREREREKREERGMDGWMDESGRVHTTCIFSLKKISASHFFSYTEQKRTPDDGITATGNPNTQKNIPKPPEITRTCHFLAVPRASHLIKAHPTLAVPSSSRTAAQTVQRFPPHEHPDKRPSRASAPRDACASCASSKRRTPPVRPVERGRQHRRLYRR